MADKIQIVRSETNATFPALSPGELAYSQEASRRYQLAIGRPGGGGNDLIGPTITTQAGVPASTPGKIGDFNVNTSNGNVFLAKGTTDQNDWVNVTAPTAGSITLAQMADLAANTFIGRDTESTGVPEAITAAAAATMMGLDYLTDNISVTQAVDLDAIETRVNALDAAVVLKGEWAANAGTFPTSTVAGESWIVSVAGTVNSVDFEVGDRVIALVNGASTTVYAANWHKADYSDKVSAVNDLSDVTITSVGSNEVLQYTGSAWENQTLAEAGIQPAGSYLTSISGLAPDTATTAATQPNITSAANLVTVGTIGTGTWQGTAIDGAYVDVEGTEIKSTGEVGGVKFLMENGDGSCSWSVPAGSGDVSKVGTPVDNQVGVWTGDGSIEGTANFTYTTDGLNVVNDIRMAEQADHAVTAPAAGFGYLWTKNTTPSTLVFTDDAGTDFTISDYALNQVDLTTDVTGLLPTGNIANDAVTYAQMQNVVADQRILGNIAGAGGPVAELTPANVLALLGASPTANYFVKVNGTATGLSYQEGLDGGTF